MSGCWFLATLEELKPGFCLVRYHELKESEEEGALQLKEWHPLARGNNLANYNRITAYSNIPAYLEDSYMVRPHQPPQVCRLHHNIMFQCSGFGPTWLQLSHACLAAKGLCANFLICSTVSPELVRRYSLPVALQSPQVPDLC